MFKERIISGTVIVLGGMIEKFAFKLSCTCLRKMAEPKLEKQEQKRIPTEDEEKVRKCLQFIEAYGGIDGAHHKQWVIDQIVRTLLGTPKAYKEWVEEMKCWNDEEQAYEYDWDEGTAP